MNGKEENNEFFKSIKAVTETNSILTFFPLPPPPLILIHGFSSSE